MSKQKIRIIANAVIAISATGILISFPFQHTFLGGLMFAVCSAAVIGGLADSFAVAALFGQPLRVKWPSWMGTNVIAKNRSRLINELVHMVQDELLSIEQINKQLHALSFSKMINQYLSKPGTVTFLQQLITLFLKEMVEKVNQDKLSSDVKLILQKHSPAIPIVELVDVFVDWMLEQQYDRKSIAFIAEQLITIVEAEQFNQMMQQFIATSLHAYEGDKLSRKFVDQVAGLDSETITVHVQHWLIRYLREAASDQSMINERLSLDLRQLLARWQEQEGRQEKLVQQIQKLMTAVTESKEWESIVNPLIEKIKHTLLEKVEAEQSNIISQKIEEMVERWRNDERLQGLADERIKRWLIQFITQYHYSIGKIVEDGLNQFDEQQLNELVQDKAGKDLQFIRLNGIVVGGMIGCLLYLSTFWIGGI